jgi:hypothetical protein
MIALSKHPKYEKYFKMMKVGIEKYKVQRKMEQEGLSAAMLDYDPSMMIAVSEGLVMLSEHPSFKRYFKMLQVGCSRDAVREKMRLESINTSILDLSPTTMVSPHDKHLHELIKNTVTTAAEAISDRNRIVADDRGLSMIPAASPQHHRKVASSSSSSSSVATAKKKLFLQGVDSRRLSLNSLWASSTDGREDDDVNNAIALDRDEFDRLFTSRSDDKGSVLMNGHVDNRRVDGLKNSEQQQSSKRSDGSTSSSSSSIRRTKKYNCLIDIKRAQNASIALARIRLPFDQLRDKLMALDDSALTSDQLSSLVEYLPTDKEAPTIANHAKRNGLEALNHLGIV